MPGVLPSSRKKPTPALQSFQTFRGVPLVMRLSSTADLPAPGLALGLGARLQLDVLSLAVEDHALDARGYPRRVDRAREVDLKHDPVDVLRVADRDLDASVRVGASDLSR